MAEFYDDFEDEFDVETDVDVEKEVKKRTKKERFNFDVMLGIFGVCLAMSSAFFPWYVFLNQDKFSISEMAYGDDRILPEAWQGKPVVNVSPQAIPGRDTGIEEPDLPPDNLTTASIPQDPIEPSVKKKNVGGVVSTGIQPFPSKPKYRLLHVVNGQALIENHLGTYIVKVGSVLPDNARLASLEERKDGWVLITSEGKVIKQ